MKPLLIPFILCTSMTPAFAQTDISNQIGTSGLSAVKASLESLPDPTPSDLFALGGVRFLSAIETALQTRYRTGVTDGLAMLSDIPVLRLPIPENPTPEPFDPAMITAMFQQVGDDLGGAITALEGIDDSDVVAVRIDTSDLWFDINMNTTRDTGETFNEVAGLILSGGFGPEPGKITINFDTADAAWLSAYAHLLSGLSDMILAFSPTESITRTLNANAAMAALSPPLYPPGQDWGIGDMGKIADLAAIVIGALEQQPDPALTRAAQGHFLDMIADNRVFWARVAQETDNDAEWIPNKKQQSVLPIDFPTDTGVRWQAVLADAEALLKGNLLIPYWRLGDDAGINLARLFQDPPMVDLVGMFQGATFVPYMEKGPLIDWTSFMLFDQLVAGDAGLFMVVLN